MDAQPTPDTIAAAGPETARTLGADVIHIEPPDGLTAILSGPRYPRRQPRRSGLHAAVPNRERRARYHPAVMLTERQQRQVDRLLDEVEAAIEARMDDDMTDQLVAPERLGRARRLDDAEGRYIEFVKATFPKALSLDGRKIVIDCANGAAYKVAPTVLWELGAEVVPVGVSPDGFNINKGCGSTDPDYMREQVIAHEADIGIALDGDADRLVIADEHGALVDGDQLMALVAGSWHAAGRLRGGGVVATVMSNLGLERYLEGLGLAMVRTPVGDRYVVEHMRAHGFNVGGEQSGHIILSDFTTTGDGLIAALQCLAVIAETGKPVSAAARLFEPFAQTLKNVRFEGASPLDDAAVKGAIADGEGRLGAAGRVLVRKSGTEPLVRIMAEGEDSALVEGVVDDIVAVIEAHAP